MTDLLTQATHLEADPPELHDWLQWQRACRDRARERVHFYRSLSPVQGRELALAALRLIEQGKNTDYLAEQLLTRVANFVPGSLYELHSLFLKQDIHWGDNGLYREADSATRDEIITLLEADNISEVLQSRHDDTDLRQNLLAALAWIGDEQVQRQFLRWRESPPSWSAFRWFRKPLDAYTHYAGWELTADGQKRELYFQQCYELIPLAEAPAQDIPGPVRVIASHEEQCAWCEERQLLTLFDFNLSDSRMDFFRLTGERLRIALCTSCSIFDTEPPFFDVDMHGASHWSKWNDMRDAFEEESISLSQGQLVLGQPRRTPFETNNSYSQRHLSQIGGHPEWVQNPDYPRCPGCQQTMMFIGQFEPMDILAEAEGMISAFLCKECGTTTTNFQCT